MHGRMCAVYVVTLVILPTLFASFSEYNLYLNHDFCSFLDHNDQYFHVHVYHQLKITPDHTDLIFRPMSLYICSMVTNGR